MNSRTELGVGSSADIVVRDRHGVLARISEEPRRAAELADLQQRLVIGQVDSVGWDRRVRQHLGGHGHARRAHTDQASRGLDPTTIDVFLINRFVNRDRQGEAFIEADGSSLANDSDLRSQRRPLRTTGVGAGARTRARAP